MELNITKSSLKKEEVPIQKLVAQIASGKAILFTGAGFSIGSLNINEKEPPTAKELAKSICNLGAFDEDDDLRFAADYYLQSKDKSILISFLKETFAIKSVNESHKKICSAKWRRYYTTNYDDSIEFASRQAGKLIECVNLSDPPNQHFKKKGICLHLNGSTENLDETSIETSFKLSTSSYINPDSFLNSRWYYIFKQDLERCSAIVFAGYSLYDIEIQKILFENSAFKQKTYFITRENPDAKSEFTMSKFGYVLPIGCNGFAEIISNHPETTVVENSETLLESLVKFELSYSDESIRDTDIETMLMYGNIQQSFLESAVLGKQQNPYLILRDALPKILEFTQNKQNLVITSEFGNGKSILVEELLPYLTVNSYDVYTISDKNGDYISDIENIVKSNLESILIIDGYEEYLDLISHYVALSPSNIKLILTARSPDHDRLKANLNSILFKYNELNIDILSEKESSFFVTILDNMGLWGEQARLSKEKKMEFLKRDNQLQISLALLNIFKSPQILQRVKDAIGNLFDTPTYKDTVFAIAMLETLGLETNSSTISEVAINDAIFNNDFRQNQSFKHLFKISENRIVSKSSLFCLSLINNHFEASYISSQLQKIAAKFSALAKDSYVENKVFKSTLKFSFVERLLPDANKKNNLYKYYEDLKISVPWLIGDPHFWLQYGMARLPHKEYAKAQSFFDQAYGLAKNKQNYYTSNIDTQQARLYILQAMDTTEQQASFNQFMDGHKLLSGLDDDIYKFRQVDKYRDYFDSKYKYLSKVNKLNFKTCCQQMQKSLVNATEKGFINLSNQKSFSRIQDNLNYIFSKFVD